MLLITTAITAVVIKSSGSYASAGIDHLDVEQLVDTQKEQSRSSGGN